MNLLFTPCLHVLVMMNLELQWRDPCICVNLLGKLSSSFPSTSSKSGTIYFVLPLNSVYYDLVWNNPTVSLCIYYLHHMNIMSAVCDFCLGLNSKLKYLHILLCTWKQMKQLNLFLRQFFRQKHNCLFGEQADTLWIRCLLSGLCENSLS